MRELPGGIKKQLLCEHESALVETVYDWQTVAWHDYPSVHPFEKRVPWCFRFVFLRQLFAWLLILKLSRQCDYLLVRHMPFDPFCFLFSPFVKNRITVHHTKEVEEMVLVRPGWKGIMASRLEYYTGRFALRRNLAIAGVTQEIVDYQVCRSGGAKSGVVYPNGIDPNGVPILGDNRSSQLFNVAFICTEFSSWHGLERLFESVLEYASGHEMSAIKIHLIGRISDQQREQIKGNAILASVFTEHGLLSESDYRKVMDSCDVGVGSLALEEKGLREASTLKVREMLAMGLPVVSGHVDSSLPESFPFYQFYLGGKLELFRVMESFGDRKFSRETVREAAEPYINKRKGMQVVAAFLDS